MTKVLLLNHQFVECGLYQIAVRIFNIISTSTKVDYQYRVVKDRNSYLSALKEVNPDFIIYNYHFDRMPWLRDSDVTENTKSKHYFIYHDGSMMKVYDKYLFFGALDPDELAVPKSKTILLPRPIYKYTGSYKENGVTTIGSFGFAFNHKRFHTIAPYVGSQFLTSRVRLHFTNPYFGDTPGNKLSDIINLCRKTCPPNVELSISTDFMSDSKVLDFLAGNDLNLFLYDISLQNPGISSAIDYALSVKRPIAVSNNMMFRHVISDDILVSKSTLGSILRRGTAPIDKFYSMWSPDRLSDEVDKLFI